MPKRHSITHDAHGLSDHVLRETVDVFKALSDPTRAQLIFLLTAREYSVNELTEHVEVSASAVSHHLAKLRTMRLVRTRREGNQIFYSIDDSHVANLFREALYHLDHVRQELPDEPYAEHIPD